jgi:hypothetical protein
MGGMTWTCFLQCDRCHIECRIDSEAPTTSASSAPLIVRHCPDSEGIPVLGKVTKETLIKLCAFHKRSS